MRREARAITVPSGKRSMPETHESTPTPKCARFIADFERVTDAAPHS
jgi:hypothetical protein